MVDKKLRSQVFIYVSICICKCINYKKIVIFFRKYPEGWSNDPGRDSQLEYRLSIFHASRDDSGVFTCVTPTRHTHSVEIEVKGIFCLKVFIN